MDANRREVAVGREALAIGVHLRSFAVETMPLSFSAVLLAAGRSTRMGRDKALLEIDGVPLWQRQRDVLSQSGAADVFLSVRPEQDWARAGKFAGLLFDDLPNAGPMA